MKSFSGTSPIESAPRAGSLRFHIIRNALVLLTGQGALILSSAVTTLVLARRLGTAQFGEYNAVLAFVGLFLPLASFSFDVVLIREMSQRRGQAREVFGAGIILRLLTSVFAIVLCVGSGVYFGYSRREMNLIALWSLSLLFSAGQLLQTPFALELNNARPTKINSILAVAGACLKLLLALIGAGLPWYLAVDLGVSILASALLFRAVKAHTDLRPVWTIDRNICGHLVRESAPLLVSGVFIAIYHRIDQQFLLRWSGAAEVGQYAGAVRVAEMLTLFPFFLMRSAFPVISSRAVRSAAGESFQLAGTCYRYLFLSVFVPIFIGIEFAPGVISLLYGGAYARAALALPWLIGAEIPIIAGVVYGHFSIAARLQKFDVLFTFINVSTNLALCAALIPRRGLAGAAIASLVSYSISIPLQLAFRATRAYSIVLFREVFRFGGVGVLTWIVFETSTRLLQLQFSAAALLATLAFVAASAALRFVTREDLNLVLS